MLKAIELNKMDQQVFGDIVFVDRVRLEKLIRSGWNVNQTVSMVRREIGGVFESGELISYKTRFNYIDLLVRLVLYHRSSLRMKVLTDLVYGNAIFLEKACK